MTENLPDGAPERTHELYEPRSGERIEEYVDILAAESTRPLSEHDKQRAQQWNDALAIGKCEVDGEVLLITGHQDVEPEYTSLAEALDSNGYLDERHEVNLDFFGPDCDKETIKLLQKAGVITHGEIRGIPELRQAFLEHSLNAPSDAVKKLADMSKKAEDLRMAHELAAGKIPHVPERIRVFSDGTALMEKLRVLQKYKRYYGNVAKALRESDDGTNLHAAKLMYTDLYRKTVNAQLAETYPDVLAFWYQVKHMNEPRSSMLTDAIETSFPMVKHLRADFLRNRARQLFVRLDHLRNGASHEPRGPYTTISPELVDFLEHQGGANHELLKARLTSREAARLDKERFNADETVELAEYLLDAIGKLSQEKDFVPKDRKTRASDNLWQVQKRDDIDAMGVEDPPGVFEVPTGLNRTLGKPSAPAVGIISGMFHEMSHVTQCDNRFHLGGVGIGAGVKGKNQTVFYEAGGIRNEDKVQRDLFGRGREQATHYMRAMMVLEAGGSESEALKAFYDSYKADNPSDTSLEAAKIAVSRVMRLARRKGGYDSQPLNYAETGLILAKTEHLSEHIKGLLFEYGAFNIGDLARLHEFDLLPERIEHFPYEKLVDATLRFVRQKLAERDAKNSSQAGQNHV